MTKYNNEHILTVLLITYNHEKNIKKCLDSIVNQKTDYPFQVWILEDCSTDSTLDVCKEYEKKYGRIITRVIAQPKNTKAKHVLEARARLDTKYFTIIEGDDWWTSKLKLNTAIEKLEKNNDCTVFAHDTVYVYEDGTKKSLVHEIHKINLKTKLSLEEAPYLHTSSRVYRNVINFQKNKIMWDINLYYSFLDKGKLYYYDKIMSQYNVHNKGSWSSLSDNEKRYRMDKAQERCNRMLKYKYDKYFSGKVGTRNMLKKLKNLLGVRLGWKTYIFYVRLVTL